MNNKGVIIWLHLTKMESILKRTGKREIVATKLNNYIFKGGLKRLRKKRKSDAS